VMPNSVVATAAAVALWRFDEDRPFGRMRRPLFGRQSASTMPIGTPGRVTIACGSMANGLMCRTKLSWMDQTAPATQWFGLTT
jgi:hypothetical protein